MNHDWASSETGSLGEFRSTRGTLYQRMVFWFVVEALCLAGFIYMLLLEPSAPVGSTLRAIVSGATPVLCLLWTATMTLLVINVLKLLRSCEVIWIYPEGFAVKSRRGELRRAYIWREIASLTGDTSKQHSMSLAFALPLAILSTALIFFLPIALELGFTGRVLEINTVDGKRYVIDRRFPERHDLVDLFKRVMPRDPVLQAHVVSTW